MRGIRAAGIGFGFALTTSIGLAQSPPAARLGVIRPVESTNIVARGQGTGTPMPTPMPPGQGGGATLSQPRPLSGGPSVTELRSGGPLPAPTLPYPGAIPVGGPIPVGPPIQIGSPYVIPAPSVVPAPNGHCATPLNMDAPLLCDPGAAPHLGVLTQASTPERLRLDADVLLWWLSSGRVPPLVTTSSPQFAGIIGQGDTRIIAADDIISSTFHSGGRFGGVYWLGSSQRWGLDGNVFFLGRNGNDIHFDSGTTAVLARPFFNLNQGVQFSELVAAPGLSTGTITINNSTQLWGAEANLRRYLTSTACSRYDFFAGYRYLNFSEELGVTERFARTANSNLAIGVPTAITGVVTDRFRTENEFNGFNMGLTGEIRRGRWFLEGRGAVALGQMYQNVKINGAQNIQFESGPAVVGGGLLALPGANIGSFTQNKFGVIPEVGLKLGLHVTPNLRLAAGYNFLYVNSVLRPGDQIDTGLDVTRIPNFPLPGDIPVIRATRPAPTMRDSGLFAQGFTVSLTYKW